MAFLLLTTPGFSLGNDTEIWYYICEERRRVAGDQSNVDGKSNDHDHDDVAVHRRRFAEFRRLRMLLLLLINKHNRRR